MILLAAPTGAAFDHGLPGPPAGVAGAGPRLDAARPAPSPYPVDAPTSVEALPSAAPSATYSWLNISGLSFREPAARACDGLAEYPPGNELVLFGGCNGTGVLGDTWTFSGGVWTELNVTGPPAREYPAMAYDSGIGGVLLFGGDSGGGALNDTWEFSNGTWHAVPVSHAPPARTRAMLSDDPYDGYVLLTGGYNTSDFQDVSDSWDFSNGNWTEIAPINGTHPSARDNGSLSFDAALGSVVLFGGYSEKSLVTLNDTWTYRGGRWTEWPKSSPSPSPREGAAIGFDPNLNATVLFGGASVLGRDADLWSFGTVGWTLLSRSGAPTPRGGAELAWDAGAGYAVVFGGSGGPAPGYLNDTYTLGPNVTASLQPTRGVNDVGQSIDLTVSSVGANRSGLTYTYQGLPQGCASQDLPSLVCTPNVTGDFDPTVEVGGPGGQPDWTAAAVPPLSMRSDPTISALTVRPGTITYGEPFKIRVYAAGGDPPFTYDYRDLPAPCFTTNDSNLTCTPFGVPPGGFPHTFEFNVTVSDVLGFRTNASDTVLVDPDPAIASGSFVVTPAETDVGRAVNFSVSVSGGTPPIQYSYLGLPGGCETNDSTAVTCDPNETGRFRVGLVVSDATGFDLPEVYANLSVSLPPKITSVSVTPDLVDAGQQVAFFVNASGGTGGLAYDYVDLPKACGAPETWQFLCFPSVAGNYSIKVVAYDGVGGADEESVALTVLADPSVTLSAGVAALDAGETFQLYAMPKGGLPPMAYSYSGLPPSCANIGSATPTCPAPAVNAPTVLTLRVTIEDLLGTVASSHVSLEIDPTLRLSEFTVSPSDLVLGSTLSLRAIAIGGTPPDRYGYAGLPPGCSASDLARLVCQPNAAGTYHLGVTISDNSSESVFANATVTVNATETSSTGPAGLGPTPVDGISWELVAGVGVLAAGLAIAGVWRRGRRTDRPSEPVSSLAEEEGVYEELPYDDQHAFDPSDPEEEHHSR